jgi:hypothetical protein
VRLVEIKDVEIPEAMQRAMAREAEAERERRAKIINARGELQASEELRQAADTLTLNPASLQLRYLQTLLELGADQNSPWSSRCRSTSWGLPEQPDPRQCSRARQWRLAGACRFISLAWLCITHSERRAQRPVIDS